MQKAANFFSRTLCALILAASAVCGYFYMLLPGEISAGAGYPAKGFGGAVLKHNGGFGYCLGAMTLKPAEIRPTERPSYIPCGTPFGVRLRADGVMVISVTEGAPAQRAGIKTGDVIRSVNGVPVYTNAEIISAIQINSGETEVILERGNSERRITLTPERNGDSLRIGAWVRDSAAGIGTLTMYDPLTGCFGGLGHPVSDITTGDPVPLGSGEITSAEIMGVIPGGAGETGELCGELVGGALGRLTANTPVGVFGIMRGEFPGTPVPMAFRQEVHCGTAKILTTTEGSLPREYEIEIEKINLLGLDSSKGMVIRVTDSELLKKTGGIVRGMSGSPIIQDGKLAGAVTHVFVNDPSRGYAVFAETMSGQMALTPAA